MQWRVSQPEKGRIMRRTIVAVALALVTHASAHAEAYPSRQVTLVVPFASGGASDILGRTVAKAMGSLLGQPVKVENAEGAGGILGTNRVVKAAPDGYTLLFAQSGITASTASNRRQIDLISSSLKPIGLIAHEPFLIIGRNSLPAQTLREVVLWLRANPYGASSSAAIGSHSHLANILFQEAASTKLKLTLDRSERQSIDDLAAGKIDVLLSSSLMSTPALRRGGVKAFAITAKERTSLAPDIPTVDEAGLAGFYFSRWYALWAPWRTPDNIVAKLNDVMARTLNDAEVARTFAGAGLQRYPLEEMAPDVLNTYQKNDFEKWLRVMREPTARLRRA
jgi:tripartite-type tricarboxylate transporter receptor subunit TctC